MTNYDYYQEEMLVAAMTGGRCKFIMEHSGGECQERNWTDGPVCDKCAERFKEWLSAEYKELPEVEIDKEKINNAMHRMWQRFNRRF